ncbi:MAG: hypothetical protein ACOY94_18480 [Bacillota bacterium]
MEEGKLFDQYVELPDGYQVQLMVLMEIPTKRPRVAVYRSRVWIGHESDPDPMLYKSEEHEELRRSIDACFSLLLKSAPMVIASPTALEAVQQQVHAYFTGAVPQV